MPLEEMAAKENNGHYFPMLQFDNVFYINNNAIRLASGLTFYHKGQPSHQI